MDMSTKERFPAALAVLFAGVLYGTTGTAQALAPVGADPSSIGLVRMLIGGLALLPLAGRESGGLKAQFRGMSGWTILAALGLAGFQFLFFRSFRSVGVALGTVAALASGPAFAGLLGGVFFRERLRASWWTATALTAAGCALMSLDGSGAPGRLAGVAMAMGAGASYSFYSLGIKKALARNGSTGPTALALLGAAVLLLPVFFASSSSLGWIARPQGTLLALHLGLLTAAAPFFLLGRGLKALPLGWVSTLGLSEPLVAALLGFLVLGESPTPAALAGIALMAAGLILSSLAAQRE